MSWSIAFVGSPAKVVEALKAQSERMKPSRSKTEFDDAMPHLIGLCQQVFDHTDGARPRGISLLASGGGYGNGGDLQRDRNITVKLETLYGFVGA